ncbi:MAG: alpha/beta fold hydrolase [Myxococcota bacterium]|nr:alpha/beta fold hydrolase [Myxococcota bacterium]
MSYETRSFELQLEPIKLECGVQLPRLPMRGWWAGPRSDLRLLGEAGVLLSTDDPAHAALVPQPYLKERDDGGVHRGRPVELDSRVPTVVVMHALTSDARVGGPGGWWETMVGEGRALDPTQCRILCFNNLGSCYGSYAPTFDDFPLSTAEPRWEFPGSGKGQFDVTHGKLPATVTTWDQARAILLGLDHLGIRSVRLGLGGSLGGMITMCLGALDARRFDVISPAATAMSASPWVIGWNHIARRLIVESPGFPNDAKRPLELARAIAHMTYRNDGGLSRTQGRRQVERHGNWHSRAAYGVQTYLEHQGTKLERRYHPASYVTQLDAMDHHDIFRRPSAPEPHESWQEFHPDEEVFARFDTRTVCIGMTDDRLFGLEHMRTFAQHLQEAGNDADFHELPTRDGHDGFLLEHRAIGDIYREILY